jgi:hypothetical protein
MKYVRNKTRITSGRNNKKARVFFIEIIGEGEN